MSFSLRHKRGDAWQKIVYFRPPLLVILRAKSRTRVQRMEKKKRKKHKETTDACTTPIKAETIQVQARWPTSGFEIEALSAMHLRYAGEKKAWLWKRKGGEESGTNDVDNNDSTILSIQTISLSYHVEYLRYRELQM